MKNFYRNFLAVTLAVSSLAAAGKVQAQKLDDLNVITVALKLQLQSPGYNSKNGLTKIYAKPVVQSISTKNLLDRLALDKQMQGLYGNRTFPGGAKLALSGTNIVVVKSDGELIVDVSDIVTLTSGENDILSGTVNNATGLASSKTAELIIVGLDFDDTFIVGGSDLSFSLQGLDNIKTSDTTPNQSTGKYVEKTSDNVDNAAGEGQSGDKPFILTGSVNGSRSTILVYAPSPT